MLCTSEHFPLCTLWVHTFTRVVAKFVKVSNSKKCKCLMSMDMKRGCVCVTFLFSFFLETEGKPNQRQNEYHKIEKCALAEGRRDPSCAKTPPSVYFCVTFVLVDFKVIDPILLGIFFLFPFLKGGLLY